MALSHAILSALIEGSCSGYDLAKRFTGSVGYFWSATQQQIYRELTKMEEQGLLQAEIIRQEGRPDKKLFSVTGAGKDKLQRWIAQPSEVSAYKDDLLVKLFAGYLVPKAVMLKELQHHRRQHEERLSIYQAIAQKSFPNPQTLSQEQLFRYLTLRNGIRYETEWLAWYDEVTQVLQDIHE